MDLTSQRRHHDVQIKESLAIRIYRPVVRFCFELSPWPFSNSHVERLLTCEAQTTSTPASWVLPP